MRKLEKLALGAVLLVEIFAFGCAADDKQDAGTDAAGTGGTGGTGGAGGAGAGGSDVRCAALSNDLIESCNSLIGSCPETLEALLTDATEKGYLGAFMLLEGDGLRQLTNWPNLGGVGYAFDDDGKLAGWLAWNDVTWGPCADDGIAVYQRGRLLNLTTTAEGVHRCDLAPDALETGVLCDCPCPDPAPSDGVVDDNDACLGIGMTPPACAPTFSAQRVTAKNYGGSLRSGCGVRTLKVMSLDCSYDEAGDLMGGERRRGEFPRDECPGVDAYRAGDVPESCGEVSTCTFAYAPAAGETPCPADE